LVARDSEGAEATESKKQRRGLEKEAADGEESGANGGGEESGANGGGAESGANGGGAGSGANGGGEELRTEAKKGKKNTPRKRPRKKKRKSSEWRGGDSGDDSGDDSADTANDFAIASAMEEGEDGDWGDGSYWGYVANDGYNRDYDLRAHQQQRSKYAKDYVEIVDDSRWVVPCIVLINHRYTISTPGGYRV
jgi:hypothetical protein